MSSIVHGSIAQDHCSFGKGNFGSEHFPRFLSYDFAQASAIEHLAAWPLVPVSNLTNRARLQKWLSLRKVCVGLYCFFDTCNEKVAFVFLFGCHLSNFFSLGDQLITQDVNECLNCHGVLKEPYIRCCSCLTKVVLCVEVSHFLSICASKCKTHWL